MDFCLTVRDKMSCLFVFPVLALIHFKKNSFAAIDEQPFYFMSGVYFCKTNDGVFVPAEVALSNFNLKYGIVKKYHTFVNPCKC